jgi:hypothetical protein
MNTASLLFLALCVDALVKLPLLVRYEGIHLSRGAVHIRTGNVSHIYTGRKLDQKVELERCKVRAIKLTIMTMMMTTTMRMTIEENTMKNDDIKTMI